MRTLPQGETTCWTYFTQFYFKGSHKATSCPHQGTSDHLSVMLLPAYRSLLKRSRLVQRTIIVWPEGATSAPQDCFEKYMFMEAAIYDQHICLEEYTDSGPGYIERYKNYDYMHHPEVITRWGPWPAECKRYSLQVSSQRGSHISMGWIPSGKLNVSMHRGSTTISVILNTSGLCGWHKVWGTPSDPSWLEEDAMQSQPMESWRTRQYSRVCGWRKITIIYVPKKSTVICLNDYSPVELKYHNEVLWAAVKKIL